MGSIVVDVGGTNLRLGYFSNGQLTAVRRVPVESRLANPGLSPAALYQAFLQQLQSQIDDLLSDHPKAGIGVAFPGPVDEQGQVRAAPTLWGDALQNIDLRSDLQSLLGRNVHILNDISAAVWRYATPECDDFCLITISSGIGNKVFSRGNVLLNSDGLGGEIGHCPVGEGSHALPCDCGGSGHLGALASGRGTLQLARICADEYPDALSASPLAAIDRAQWSTTHLVAALHAGDDFAWTVCTVSQRYLITAMRQLYHWIGTRRFIFIGGFATAIGDRYIANLNGILLQDENWFGMPRNDMATMCSMGEADDDHSLIGMGAYLAAWKPS